MMLRGLLDRILAFAAVAVLVAGAVGFMIDNLSAHPGPVDAGLFLRLAFQSFTQAVKLFAINISLHPDTDNWLLMFARVCGAIVAAAAVFRLIVTVFGRDYNAFRATFYRNHAVILGYGLRNALFADNWRALDPAQKQIIIDHDDARVRPLIRERGRLFFRADLALPNPLQSANIARANLIIIGTGTDARNLAISHQVIDLRETQGGDNNATIIVTLEDAALADRCRNNSDIARPANGDQLYFCNNATLAARQLLTRTPFVEHALAQGQRRVRLVFAGFSQTALEIILQMLRLSPVEDLDPVRIDIVTPNITSALDLIIERAPNLRHMLSDEPADPKAPLAWAGRLYLHEHTLAALSYQSELFAALDDGTPLSAIVVAGDDAVDAAKTALAIRPWTAQHPAFAAPIYVQAGAPSSLEKLYVRYDGIAPKPVAGLLARLRGSLNAADAIEPFGMLEELCAPEFVFGKREDLARMLHAAYQQNRMEALRQKTDTTRSELPDWERLDETYRQANRRAVDFLPIMRLAAAAPDMRNNVGRHLLADLLNAPDMLERLARLVHASWRIDRELDGWRPGTSRDVRKRLHTDLVAYDDLTEEKKELDREQVRLLAAFERMELRP